MSQLFKNTVDKTLLYNFLQEVCNPTMIKIIM